MITKAAQDLSFLYDLSGFYLIDSDSDKVVITDMVELHNNISNYRASLSKVITENLTGKIKTGDIILVTDKDMNRKTYCLISVACGQVVPYVIYDVDFSSGNETIADFSKGDVEMLSEYPMFKDTDELVFFLTNLNYIFSDNGTADDRALIHPVKTYLDKGLWATLADGMYGSAKEIADKLGLTKISHSDIMYEKDGKYLAFYDNNFYGDYDLVKAAFCEMVKAPEVTNFLYNNSFGSFFSKGNIGMVMTRFADFENDVKLLSQPAIAVKTEAEVTEEIVQSQEAKSIPVIEDFFAKAEAEYQAEIEAGVKDTKAKKKKKREKSFEVQAQISQQEKDIAITETIMKPGVNITIPKLNKLNVAKSDKVLEQKLNSPADYPADWDYVYTVDETSKLYNKTIGQKYDPIADKFILSDEEKEGMSVADWNAYFIAHPELARLSSAAEVHIGKLTMTKEELIESGHLLYSRTGKWVYVHEYLVGNVYKLIEDLEAFKEAFIEVNGEPAYDRQMNILLAKRPKSKSIISDKPSEVPFIHPLDEVVVDYTINSAANLVFHNSLNWRLMASEKKRLEAEIKAGKMKHTELNETIDSFGRRYQTLSIVVFFRAWLRTRIGQLAAYGLRDIDLVNLLYFEGISYKSFIEAMIFRGTIIPKGQEPEEVITTSDYFEAKDDAKRFVNDLFQVFLQSQISDDDRVSIEYAWNKHYNGYITVDAWKLPIFIRHSKYFKDRVKKNKLQLQPVQVHGIKFATIDNSSIIAHEVGYGKTLVAICYMSHCFETGQASNFLVAVPKPLYVNRKWREEIAGLYDPRLDRYIVGAVPIYNIIELGNLSATSVWANGKSQFKTYSDEEEYAIRNLLRLFTEIGGKEAGVQKGKSVGTATIPTNPYNFRMAISGSNYAWSKLINKILPELDKNLFYRSVGQDYEQNKDILNYLAGFTFSKNAKDKEKDLFDLKNAILQIMWKRQVYDKMFDTSGVVIPEGSRIVYDKGLSTSEFSYKESLLPSKKERDAKGKIIKTRRTVTDGKGGYTTIVEEKMRPDKQVYEEFLMNVFEDLHSWIEGIIQKMADFAIYDYGTWKFNSGTNNIILATKQSLDHVGFSRSHIEKITSVVKEITTYKNEESFDEDRSYEVTIVDNTGAVTQKFKRDPAKVLQKQLQEMINSIESNMTEAADRGKFFLDNLKIDGFILDEAHMAKKVFTNVKTDARVELKSPEGPILSVKTTSHDIRGSKAPSSALAVFGVCQYIKSLGNKKPVMLLTATPFSNHPTEIFSMLSLVGINQLRDAGVSNIKTFFDLFLKETLKFDFDHNGEFIKRISVEDFRNKEMLLNLIWSVMDIKREASLDGNVDEKAPREKGQKPLRKVFPRFTDLAMQKAVASKTIDETESLGDVNTVALLDRLSVNTCSIVDQNDIQRKMLQDIENVSCGVMNPKTLLNYTFDDVCPNAAIYGELSDSDEPDTSKKRKKKDQADDDSEHIVVSLRTIVNSNIKQIPNGLNVETYADALAIFPNMKYGELVFVAKDKSGSWAVYKKEVLSSSSADKDILIPVATEDTALDTIKTLAKRKDYGVTFKALGMARGIALSPYLYSCNDLPEPTPENLIKYSPKIEYLVKAIKSVKDHHIIEIPKKIKILQAELDELKAKPKLTKDESDRYLKIANDLSQLERSREVSGQVVYMNTIRFDYYSIDKDKKAVREKKNLAKLIKSYLVDKGWFTDDEVAIISSDSSGKNEQVIKDFQDGKIKVLFGTQSIKEGVDLQNKTSTMYIMTPDWNPTDMRQVEGRVWRRDNENLWVRIVYVLLDQSVEIFIYSKLEEKARRLQQIMKERNTIEEVEEMSLNPNETKVALASDPEKRADIVTKLSQAILIDQRNKLNKSREEINGYAQNIDIVNQNVDVARDQYLMMYEKEYAKYKRENSEFVIINAVELYKNEPASFVTKFRTSYFEMLAAARHYNDSYYGYAKVYSQALTDKISRDNTLTLAFDSTVMSRDVGYYLQWMPSLVSPSAMQDFITALEIGIEKRDEILAECPDKITIDVINRLMPMRSSLQNEWPVIDSRLTGEYDADYNPFLFRLTSIVYAFTDDMRDIMLRTFKEIRAEQAKRTVTYYELKEQYFPKLVMLLMKELEEYPSKSPMVRPENYYPYYAAQKEKNMEPSFTEDEFDAFDLPKKISILEKCYDNISGILRAFDGYGVGRKRDLIAGKEKAPSENQIIVAMGLADEDPKIHADIITALRALFTPITQMAYRIKEIEESYLRLHGGTINDLPVIAKKLNDEYAKKNKEIKDLDIMRIKLIEKYTKINEQRSADVTIDKVVAKFALSNSLLELKF